MSEFKKLIQRRGVIKSQISMFEKYLYTFTSDKMVQLNSRLEKFKSLWDDFSEIQTEIEIIDESEEQLEEREHFQDKYFELLCEAESKIKKLSEDKNFGVLNAQGNSNTNMNSNIKFPKIQVPTFNGSYELWPEFEDAFSKLVDNNPRYSQYEKMFYLKSSVSGEAAEVLESFESTSDNYNDAWELLRIRFKNKKMIALKHLNSLVKFSSITKPSAADLRKLINTIRRDCRALKNLGYNVDDWDTLLVYLLESKLDHSTQQKWAEESSIDSFNSMAELLSFLERRCQILEKNETTRNNSFKTESRFTTGRVNLKMEPRGNKTFAASTQACILCKAPHNLAFCKRFQNMSLSTRRDETRRLKLCFNCLKSNHTVYGCTAGGCRKCGRRHHELLHPNVDTGSTSKDIFINNRSAARAETVQHENSLENHVNRKSNDVGENSHSILNSSQGNSQESQNFASNSYRPEVLLSTAIVYISDKRGKLHEARALLDSGSQSNFMSKELRQRLNLSTENVKVPIIGIGEGITDITHSTKTTIHSRFNHAKFDLHFLIISNITENLPTKTINLNQITIPENIHLADDKFNQSNKIDLLLGASIFWELLCIGQIKLGNNLPIMQKTKLGWVVSGTIPIDNSKHVSRKERAFISQTVEEGSDLQNQIAKFWEIEECSENQNLSKEEMRCELLFNETTIRENGRFLVAYPFKENMAELGDSHSIALKRLHQLERKFAKNKDMESQYKQFISEYIELGHMTKIDERNDGVRLNYYLPHHGVFKETSSTTKCRVVFDGSAITTSGLSLNDTLMVGPKIQQNLFNILLRFRIHNIVVAADIEKMYRQVLVKAEHKDMQRILWRFSTDQPVDKYELNTVTYGLAPSSYLATRCLQQLALENKEISESASNVILRDFYVDDLLTGGSSTEEIIKLKSDICDILSKGGFVLRKWISNNKEIFKGEEENLGNTEFYLSTDAVQKTLGLLWNSESDSLQYGISLKLNCRPTKRAILSGIAQIFDPLGLVGPIIIKAKLIMQRLWALNLNWDESVPQDIHTSWVKFQNSMSYLKNINIPRHVVCINPTKLELHCFSDASEAAYGAAIFIRSFSPETGYSVKLICAKSKVAPLKVISLPKLELCGALLAAKLSKEVMRSLGINWFNIYYWSDSLITLSWIAGDSSQWKTFVANRTSEIQKLTEGCQWRHVESKDNPADVISRGCDAETLQNSKIWWNGPKWLHMSESYWPDTRFVCIQDVPETRPLRSVLMAQINFDLFERFSKLSKLQRVVAYCLRFIKIAKRQKSPLQTINLQPEELHESLLLLIKIAQGQSFKSELHALKTSKSVAISSQLSPLNPYLDDLNIIRLGGRLNKANIGFDQKHPIILPKGHALTKLIILHEHHKKLHAGPQMLLATIRLKYWLISGRNTIRSVLRSCVTCFRTNPQLYTHIMGDLPTARVTPSRPFTNVGVDYAGPFQIRINKVKGHTTIKAYMCIFICFSTKAVHLEVVGDLSTESFLNCFKRFIARRGICKNIYSDNGSNFIGANNQLKDMYEFLKHSKNKTVFDNYFSENNIKWHFIPPHSPHMGGLWEAGVKAAKYYLRRIMGNETLYYDEFNTIITQVESCLNSRPLTPLTEDKDDLNVLTPGHFLIGSSLQALPEEDLRECNAGKLKRYQHMTKMLQRFWTQWSRNYLSHLQERQKWRKSSNPIKIGDMVILKDDNLPPMRWQLGRVVELHPGEDNIVRVVTVRTQKGLTKRASSRLCILPIGQ